MSEPFDRDPKVNEWLKQRNADLRPMISDSAYAISLISGKEPDAKQAVELGFMILLDKPIVLAVVPGVKVPERLARCADEIVEVDLEDFEGTQRSLQAAMERLGLEDKP
jgi:nucleoside 2-deoxyribosyltransferase